MRSRHVVVLLGLAGVALGQSLPTTVPADPTVDWLLGQRPAAVTPATLPSTLPAGGAASPLTKRDAGTEARAGTITMSDGSVIKGDIRSTAGKPMRVWDDAIKQYVDIPFKAIASAKAGVLWERDEKEWHFVASGSDIKEYTGKSYPARETTYEVTLSSGKTVAGGVVAPLYVTTPEGERLLVLNKRAKGEVGQGLKDLVYVQAIRFDD